MINEGASSKALEKKSTAYAKNTHLAFHALLRRAWMSLLALDRPTVSQSV
jgi:hypothetical protein